MTQATTTKNSKRSTKVQRVFDDNGLDQNGLNRRGNRYGQDGRNAQGYTKAGYDKDGYDILGRDRWGFYKDGSGKPDFEYKRAPALPEFFFEYMKAFNDPAETFTIAMAVPKAFWDGSSARRYRESLAYVARERSKWDWMVSHGYIEKAGRRWKMSAKAHHQMKLARRRATYRAARVESAAA